MKSMLQINSAVLCAVAIVAMGNCKGKVSELEKSGIVTFKQGAVTVTKKAGQPSDLAIKDLVSEGDTIATGEKAAVVVQFADNYVLRVDESSTVYLVSVDLKNSEMMVRNGQVLSKLLRGGASNAVIKTPTAVASVRGTQFSVQYRNKMTMVAVSEGKVSVRSGRHDSIGTAASVSKEEIITDAGKTLDVSEAAPKGAGGEAPLVYRLRPITSEEKLALKKIETMPVIPSADRKTPEEIESAIKKAIEKDPGAGDKVKALMEQKTRTLDDIHKVFNRIDEVTLYDGRVLQGAIMSRGDTFTILTTEGTVSFPEDKIKESRIVK